MPTFSLITSIHDDLLLPWLDLYEFAFPPLERVPVSVLFRFLKEKEDDFHMLAAVDEEGAFAGLAFYVLPAAAGGRAAFLWYLAMLPELRGQGMGTWMYRGILARLPRGVEALVFDVEIPEQTGSAGERELALRRIRFYRRLGARVLTGVRYTMRSAPDRPVLQMHLMIHPRMEMSPAVACELVRLFLPDAVEVIGDLALE